MFQNYLKTALRNLLREKGSSLLNIAGLTLGITCSLLLFLLIRHLATFDNFHANRDRIYRVVTQMDSELFDVICCFKVDFVNYKDGTTSYHCASVRGRGILSRLPGL